MRGTLAADLTGQSFGRLTVIEKSATVGKRAMWLCRCICGNEVVVRGGHLRAGLVQSCKCLQRERKLAANTSHGAARRGRVTREFQAWCSMKARCLYPGQTGYAYYGGRGITVCEDWLHSFENFIAEMGSCPDGLTLDRIDSDGNYEPSNCRWATRKQQSQNRRYCKKVAA